MNKIASLLLAALFVLCMSACGGGGSDKEGMTYPDAVVFTDALGRTVSVPRSVGRVAALIGSFADVWQLAGGTVCASAEDAWDDLGLDMGDAVNIGKTKAPDIELLFSAEPELVLASASTAADVEMKDTLENAGITVAYFDVSCFEDYLEMLEICTDITGRKDLYEKNGTEIQRKIEAVKTSFDGASMPEERKTVLFLRASSGYIRAKNSEGSILGEMLKDMGCVNIADNDSSLLENLSIESIIKADPYHIFIVQVGDDEKAVMDNISKMMEENPAWKELGAVKGDRLHYMDKRLFNLKPNARWGEAYEALGAVLQK